MLSEIYALRNNIWHLMPKYFVLLNLKAMIRNYLTIAFRNLKKYKIFSILNIFGLALGISCVIFIYSFINYELSFEKCYPKSDRIYRVTKTSVEAATTRYWAPTLGPALAEYMPEIENSCRMFQIGPSSISINDSAQILKKFVEDDGFYADPAVFEIFDVQFSEGDAKTALDELQSIVISESMAERFFPNQNALDQTLTIDDLGLEFLVKGVMKNVDGIAAKIFD